MLKWLWHGWMIANLVTNENFAVAFTRKDLPGSEELTGKECPVKRVKCALRQG